MRLIDADELKKKAKMIDWLCNKQVVSVEYIDNAPTFTPKVEFVTINGITFPKALETMTFSHELTTEERQNIEKAYMLGVYSNERPQGEWIEDLSNYDNHYPKHIQDIFRCSICGFRNNRQTNFCSECGADMRGDNNDL